MNATTPRPVRFTSGPVAERIQARRDARAITVTALALAWEAELEAAADSLLAMAAGWEPGRTCYD
jgi:hypothetical protein